MLIGNNRIVMLLEPFSYTLSSREAEGRRAGGGGGGGGVDCISARRLHDGSINHLLDFVKFVF